MDFALTEEQNAIYDMAFAFGQEHIAPHAIEWDEKEHFPKDVVRSVGELGMAGIYVREDVGGSALSRLDATLIFGSTCLCLPINQFFYINPII